MANAWLGEDGFEGGSPPAPPSPFHGRARELSLLTGAMVPGARVVVYPGWDGLGAGCSAIVLAALDRAGVQPWVWSREIDGPRPERAVASWALPLGVKLAGLDLARQVAAVAAASPSAFVLLDGVEVADRAWLTMVLGALPSSASVVVVAASESAAPDGLDRLALPRMAAVDALSLLGEELGRIPQHEALAIVEAAGAAPLSLRLVGRRGRITPTDEPLSLVDLPSSDALEVALVPRLQGNRAAAHAFVALLLTLDDPAQRALRAAAVGEPGLIRVDRLASSLRASPDDVDAWLRAAAERALVIPHGPRRYRMHTAIREWLRALAAGVSEEAALRDASGAVAAAALRSGSATWTDLLVGLDAAARARTASDREQLVRWADLLVVGSSGLEQAGLIDDALALAASALKLPGAPDARTRGLERWLRERDRFPSAPATGARTEAPPPRAWSHNVEALRLELVDTAGEASIAAAEAAARAAVFVETGRRDAAAASDPALAALLRELIDLGLQADAASDDGQAAVEEVLVATTASRVEAAAQRSLEAQAAAERLANQAEATWEALRKQLAVWRARVARRDALLARLRDIEAAVEVEVSQAREQVRAMREELPVNLSGMIADTWAGVPKGLTAAMDAQRGLPVYSEQDDEAGLTRALHAGRAVRTRCEQALASALSAAMEAVRLARLAGEQQHAVQATREHAQRGRDASERFQATRRKVLEVLGPGADPEADALRAEVQQMSRAVELALAELSRLSQGDGGVEAGGRVRLAQRNASAISQRALDVLALLERAEEVGAQLRLVEASRAIEACHVRARRELAAIDARSAELSTKVREIRARARERASGDLRDASEAVASAWATFTHAAEATRSALRGVERAPTRQAAESTLESALRHVTALIEHDTRVVVGLERLGVAARRADEAELDGAKTAVGKRLDELDAAVARVVEMRDEASTLLATIDLPGLSGLVQRLNGAWDRMIFAHERARDAVARTQAATSYDDASRGLLAVETAARGVLEAEADAEQALARCQEIHTIWVEERRRAHALASELRQRVASCAQGHLRLVEALEEVRSLINDVDDPAVQASLDQVAAEATRALAASQAAERAVIDIELADEATLNPRLTAAGSAFKAFEEAVEAGFDKLERARISHADALASRNRKAELRARIEVLLDEATQVVASAARRVDQAHQLTRGMTECADDLARADRDLQSARDAVAGLHTVLEQLVSAGPQQIQQLASQVEDIGEDAAAAAEGARASADDAIEVVERRATERRRADEATREAARARYDAASRRWSAWRAAHEASANAWIALLDADVSDDEGHMFQWRGQLADLAGRIDVALGASFSPDAVEATAQADRLEALVAEAAHVDRALDAAREAVARVEYVRISGLVGRVDATVATVADALASFGALTDAGVAAGTIDPLIVGDAAARGNHELRVVRALGDGLSTWLMLQVRPVHRVDTVAAVVAFEQIANDASARISQGARELIAESKLRLDDRRIRVLEEAHALAERVRQRAPAEDAAPSPEGYHEPSVHQAVHAWWEARALGLSRADSAMEAVPRIETASRHVDLERERAGIRALVDALDADLGAVDAASHRFAEAVAEVRAARAHALCELSVVIRRELESRRAEVAHRIEDVVAYGEAMREDPAVDELIGELVGDLIGLRGLVVPDGDPSLGPEALWSQALTSAGALGECLAVGLRADRAVDRLHDEVDRVVRQRFASARQRIEDAVSAALNAEAEASERLGAARRRAAAWPGDERVLAAVAVVAAAAEAVFERTERCFEASTEVVGTASVRLAEEIAAGAEQAVGELDGGRAGLERATQGLDEALRDALAEEIAAVRERAREVERAVADQGALAEQRATRAEELTAGWTVPEVLHAVADVQASVEAVRGLAGQASAAADRAADAIDAAGIGDALEAVREVEARLVDAAAEVDGAGHALAVAIATHQPDQVALIADDSASLRDAAEEAALRAEIAQNSGAERVARVSESRVAPLLATLEEHAAAARSAAVEVAAAIDRIRSSEDVAEARGRVLEAEAAVRVSEAQAAAAESVQETLEQIAHQEEDLAALRGASELRVRDRVNDLQVSIDELELTFEATRREFESTAPEPVRERWRSIQVRVWQLAQELARLDRRAEEVRVANDADGVVSVASDLERAIDERLAAGQGLLAELQGVVDTHIRFAQDERDRLEARIEVRRSVSAAVVLERSSREALQRAHDCATRTPEVREDFARCLEATAQVVAAAAEVLPLADLLEAADGEQTRALARTARARMAVVRAAAREAVGRASRAALVAEAAAGARRADQDAAVRALRARALELLTQISVVPEVRGRVRAARAWTQTWTEHEVVRASTRLQVAWERVAATEPRARSALDAVVRAADAGTGGRQLDRALVAVGEIKQGIAEVFRQIDTMRESIQVAHVARQRAAQAEQEHARIADEVASRLRAAGEGGVDQRRALFERGLEVARRKGDLDEMRGWMVDLAELRMEMGQPAEAVRLLEGALPLAAARSGRAEAQVTARLARAARLAGDPNVLARCARALELAERAGDRALTHGVLTDLAVAAARIGDRGASAAALRRARDLAAFAEDARPSLLLDLRAAQVDLLQGDARSARDRAIEVAPRLAAAGDRAAAVAAGLIASESARRLGDAGVAVVAAERARLWADRADPDVEGLVKLAEAQAWLSAGRPARARRLARSVRAPGVSRAVDEAAARSLAVSAAREGFGAVSDSAATAWAASKDTRRRLRRGDRMPVPASTLRGAFVVAAARWEEVAEHAARRRDDVAVAEALVRVAWAWRSAGDDARLAAAVDAARRSLESLSDPATVRRLRASTERALLDT